MSVRVVRVILLAFSVALACVTILTHIAQTLHMSFRWYSLLCLTITSPSVIAVIRVASKQSAEAEVRDRSVLSFVLLLGLGGAILGLVIHRPDTDDWIYVPDAVYYLQHPQSAMGYETRIIYAEGQALLSGFPKPYEYGQAVIAYYTGTEYLFVYHILAAAVVGFLIPLSLFFAAFYFSPTPKENAIGTLIAVCTALLLAETHRTFGNVSFARTIHGKMLCLSAGIPMFAAFSLEYFRKRSFLAWFSVCAVATAMVGASSTSVVMIPALASILAFVHLAGSRIDKRQIVLMASYLGALAYIPVYIFAIWSYAVGNLGLNSPANQGWPTAFSGHLSYLINPKLPLTPVLFLLAATVNLIYLKERKKLFAWIIAAVVLYLNPVTAPFLIRHVTTPNIYWRMFYLLPFPLIVVTGIASVLARYRHFLDGRRLAIITVSSVIIVLALQYPLEGASVFRKGNGVRIGWPGYKLPPDNLTIAREVMSTVPPGPMLAPLALAGAVQMLSSHYPQMRNSDFALYLWLNPRGQSHDADLRIRASHFIADDGGDFEAFRETVSGHPGIRSILMTRSVWSRPAVQDLCKSNNFVSVREIGDKFISVWR